MIQRTQFIISLMLATYSTSVAQPQLTSELLESSAIRFTLTSDNQITDSILHYWNELIGESQFVGLAEVHNSDQLSYFTKAILPVLKEKGFDNFALEMGPNGAEVLEKITKIPNESFQNIKSLNNRYGKKARYKYKTPMVFVHNKSDALFVEEAARLNFNFWGLDQEYSISYEMHLDNLYKSIENPSQELRESYKVAKKLVHSNIHKQKVKGESVYKWYISSPELEDFFSALPKDDKTQKAISDIKTSWDIYYRHVTRNHGNSSRASHMKANFNNYYSKAEKSATPKVFLKMGGIHLAKGISWFGVDDIGKYVTEKSVENGTEFLSIRHLRPYKNGKSNIGKPGWKEVSLLLELGRKDQWTVVDLRPFREMLLEGKITTNKKYEFELKSYDLLLLSPSDTIGEPNF